MDLKITFVLFVLIYLACLAGVGVINAMAITWKFKKTAFVVALFGIPITAIVGNVVLGLAEMVFGMTIVLTGPQTILVTTLLSFVAFALLERQPVSV